MNTTNKVISMRVSSICNCLLFISAGFSLPNHQQNNPCKSQNSLVVWSVPFFVLALWYLTSHSSQPYKDVFQRNSMSHLMLYESFGEKVHVARLAGSVCMWKQGQLWVTMSFFCNRPRALHLYWPREQVRYDGCYNKDISSMQKCLCSHTT